MIKQTLDLNLIPGRVLPRINVSQYDKGTRTLEFTIYNGEILFNPTGYTAYIQGQKPDGHGFNYAANIANQKISVDVVEQMTAVSGSVACEIVIKDGSDQIGTGNFILQVEAAAMPDDATMSESDYNIIQQAIEDAQEAVTDAEAWANGTRNGQAIPATDPAYQKNSKYWSQQSDTYAQQSSGYSEDAEAWAVGTRNGTPVPSGSPEYENNAAYWANEARNVAQQTTYTEQDDSLALAPTSAGNALPITIYGQSTQNGTPTPSSPVDIDSSSADFKCVGKNLISYPYKEITKTVGGITFTDNGNGTITVSGTANADYIQYSMHMRGVGETNDWVVKNGTYILSGCPSGGGNNKYSIFMGCTKNGGWYNLGRDGGNGVTIVLNGDDYSNEEVNPSISIEIRQGQSFNPPITFKPMFRLATVEDATYEPYKHTDITTNLTLRSIEVTSSDPYNLVKDGHYYIADTIDWDEVDGYTLTKRIEEVDIANISSGWGYNETGTKRVFTSMANLGISNIVNVGSSNRFVLERQLANSTWGEFLVSDYLIISLADNANINSKEDFYTWVGSNPIKFYFALATPTKTSLTSAQAKALLSMRTYDESTSIDAVNAPAPVLELEYAKTRTPALALTGHNMAHINAIDIGDM